MSTSTIRAGFRLAVMPLVIAAVFLTAGCVSIYRFKPKDPPPMSQIQWRELQTRFFNVKDETFVSKAVLAALQDEGFIVTAANSKLGLITASKQVTQVKKDGSKMLGGGGIIPIQTARKIDATATVALIKNQVRVRINFTSKGITQKGGVLWSQPVYDAEKYQAVFSKIDKSVFLQTEDL